MTKQIPDEATLKCHMPNEGIPEINLSVTNMVEKNSLAICGATFSSINPAVQYKPKTPRVKTKINSFKSRLGRIMHRLYNLEIDNQPEKTLNIDINLYQMENY